MSAMSVYMIVSIEDVFDPELYKQYVSEVRAIVNKYGGRYLARGGEIISFAGEWEPRRLILIEFDSLEKAQECFNCPEYRKLAPLREEPTITKALFVEGVQRG